MATYGRRSSQRLRREEPDVTSSSRHPVSSSRREAEVSTGSQTQSSRSTRRLDDDDNPTYPIWGFMIRPNQLSMTDTARKQAEQVGQAEINKKAADLARYAMACEYSRTLIRKDDIRTKVLDNNTSRSFAPVFNAAQQLLFRTFGMYMVEVRAKGADNAELARQAQQVLRTATSSANGLRPRNQQRNDSAGPPDGQATNIWVVRSALPLSIITGLVCADEELSHAYALSSTSNTSSSTSQRRRQPAKELRLALDWKSADRQDGEMGLLYIILALILVNGRIITDGKQHVEPRFSPCE
uniref:MAGE domain-containing protein n=1 Tax=Melanopsichium pennsylvanicum 4 TaxID=1398559 RepID=A0A077R4Q3_9BASI|nr:conserved hypothetical protein [Melanopsichium pennsylvanicum 4]